MYRYSSAWELKGLNMDKINTGRLILRLIFLVILCVAAVIAGGGIAFLQRRVGLFYLVLLVLWGWTTAAWRKEGVPSTYDKRQRTMLIVFGVISVLLLFIAPAWEYTHFAGPIPRDGALAWIGLAIFGASIALQAEAMRELRGFYTLRLGIQPGHQLVRSGPYRFVRHPGYLGFILSVMGIGLSLSSVIALVSVIPTVLFILWRIKGEEEMLLTEFGEEYKTYMQETRRLIPLIY
jgi:protein-S-isoprenylcysteine O-methyltransferase Ste14